MSYYEVTSGELRARAEEMRNLNGRFKSEEETLRGSEQNLKTMWDGEANEAFHSAFMHDASAMDMFHDAVDQYIEALLVIAERYEIAERKNAELARSRSY